jgi:chromosome segregation ATPase
MISRCLLLLSICGVASGASVNTVQEQQDTSQKNPIRKVVTMLQNMQKKVTAEGEKEKDLYEKFMCYCKTSGGALQETVSAAESKIPEVTSAIEEGTAKKVQLEDEVKSAQTSRAEAKEAIAKATAIREKEASAFKAESTLYKQNIDALKGAISAISSGMSGGFLQTSTAATIRKIALNGPNMEDADRQELLSFLSGKQDSDYMPKSGEITGILKTMEDEMSKTLADITADEDSAVASFKELMAAKTKEIESLTKAIETKSKRVGELAVELVMMKNDLDDTQTALMEDQKFARDLEKNCATKEKEWDEICAERAQELVALAETIKILNDDDALEMFKKTLPSASSAAGFLQLAVDRDALRNKALAVIVKMTKSNPLADTGFVELALRGKKIGFEKVIKMIENMVAHLKTEQIDDDVKKEYCGTQLDETEDKHKSLEQKISDLEASIADAKEGISTTTSELEKLNDGVKALDKSVAEATEQRKEEHEDHTELMANDNAAKQLLDFAKNRLNKFYNPKLYNPPPKRELSEEALVSTNTEGTVSFAQVRQHTHHSEAPPPPPEAPKAFEKKTEESGGVIAMIDLLIKDLDKEMQTAEVEEKDAQKEYEDLMADSAEKRAKDSKAITDKTAMKAQLEMELQSSEEGKTSTVKELMATHEYMQSLHSECDWLLKYFDVRKEARASEIDALGQAKAVLSGADFSLLQQVAGPKFLNRK